MKQRRKIINLLLIALLVLSLCMFAACNNNSGNTETEPETETEELTEGLLITNSDFKVASGTVYPLSPSNWTGSASSSTAFPNDVIAGVIDVSATSYDDNKSAWNSVANPGKTGDPDDNDMLMIYMPTADTDIEGVDEAAKDIEYGPTAYNYASSDFTIEQGYYYKLHIDVKTVNIAGNDSEKAGARIYVSSTAYAEFRSVNTDGEWESYDIYIEASKAEDKTLTVSLGLGYYSSTYATEYLTTGYAFFDNIALEKIAATETKTAKQQYDEITDTASDNVAKMTYTVPNGEFDFGTAIASSSTAAPSLWTIATSGANGDNAAPTSYRYNGIVDTDAAVYAANKSKLGTTVYVVNPDNSVSGESSVKDLANPTTAPDAVGSKVYMLSQYYMTAQYIYTSTPIVIEKGKYYVLSVPVYTTGIYGEGVTVTLSGNGDEISFTGISKSVYDDEVAMTGTAGTTAGWRTYTFAIKGNEYRDIKYTLQLWLGTGDTSDNIETSVTRYTGAADDYTTTTKKTTQTTYTSRGTFAKGWAFFDDIKLTESSASAYELYSGAPLVKTTDEDTTVDGESGSVMRLDLEQINCFTSFDSLFDTYANDAAITYDDNTLGTPDGWATEFDADSNNTLIGGVSIGSSTRAGVVDTADDGYFTTLGVANPGVPFDIGTTKVLMLYNATNQLYNIDSGNFTITKNTAYRIAVWVKTAGIQSTSGAYLSVLNADDKTEQLAASSLVNSAEYENEFTNDWIEYTFIVRGYSDKDIEAVLRLSIGSGNKWTSGTLASGAAFFANANCCEITETEYTTLASSSTYNSAKSYGTTESGLLVYNRAFNLIDLDKTEGLVNGELSGALGVPLNWSVSSEKTEAKSGIGKFDTADGVNFTVGNNSQLELLGYQSVIPGATGKLGGDGWSIYDNWPTDNTDPVDNLSGGPSALIIDGTPGTDSYALGYTSDSITLTKANNYSISVWVRTIGTDVTYSLYLIGENGSTTYFGQENFIQISSSDNTWTKHTFNIEVGLTDTTVKLGLWLGTDSEVTDEVKSKGIVIFDSVAYSTTLTSEEFDALSQNTNDRKISLLSDGFDEEGNEISAKSSLVSPADWTGSVVTNGTASNSVKGVIYVKDLGSYIDINNYFGLSYPDGYDEMEEGSEKDAITAEVEASKIPASELVAMPNGGNRFLIINNKEANGYYYKGSAYTLSAETYFSISVWVKTYNVEEGKGAYVYLDVGDSDKEFTAINNGAWTKYTFYIKTADTDVSNVTLTLGLGKAAETEEDTSSFVTGYAMFDNVTFDTLTQAEYENISTDSEEFTSGRAYMIETPESSADVGDDGDDTNDPVTYKPDLTYLWWMIPTICMAVAIIAVLIAFFVKKVYKPRKEKILEASYSKDAKTSDSLEVKKEEYDKFKE